MTMTEEVPQPLPPPPPPASFSTLSDSQLMALAIIPIITGFLSLIGSSLVIYMLLRRPNDRSQTYRRLLFGVSFFDILASSVGMLGTTPIPKETGVMWAQGNTATCNADGFLSQLGLSNMLYNASLILFFLLKVRYKVNDYVIAKRIEPFMHLASILIPICFGIVGISLELYNPASIGLQKCYIAPYPPGCNEIPGMKCTRGENARPFLWSFLLIPNMIVLAFLLLAVFLIFWTVWQQERRARFTQHNDTNLLRATAMQSILYGVFFFNTYMWLLIHPLADAVTTQNPLKLEKKIYPFQVLFEIFFPLQGMFTFIIFIRPRFLRLRQILREESFLFVLKQAIFAKQTTETIARRGNRISKEGARLAKPAVANNVIDSEVVQ